MEDHPDDAIGRSFDDAIIEAKTQLLFYKDQIGATVFMVNITNHESTFIHTKK